MNIQHLFNDYAATGRDFGATQVKNDQTFFIKQKFKYAR